MNIARYILFIYIIIINTTALITNKSATIIILAYINEFSYFTS